MQDNEIREFLNMLGSKRQILKRNLIGGIARGIGVGIGVTIATAIIILLFRKIIALNIPVIGEFVTDIVEIVENNRRM